MKRIHVHLHVEDLDQNVRFYEAVFGVPPTVRRDDYAKWRLDDPRVNFALSTCRTTSGLGHLGIEVASDAELDEIASRARSAELAGDAEPDARCCYARSNKHWLTDPQSVQWEIFHTVGQLDSFGAPRVIAATPSKPCCA